MNNVPDLILGILMRSHDVNDWPADEQALHRDLYEDASRDVAVAQLRLNKILAAAQLLTPSVPTTGAELIAAERIRQITAEGFDAAHDRGHASQLTNAAIAYSEVALSGPDAWHSPDGSFVPPGGWPWGDEAWNPAGDPVRDLVKSGALIAAAIDAHNGVDGAPLAVDDTTASLSSHHEFEGERCTLCGVNQLDIITGESGCVPHPLMNYSTESATYSGQEKPGTRIASNTPRTTRGKAVVGAGLEEMMTGDGR